jgi:hypothetical protein
MITKWKYIVMFVGILIALCCCGSEKQIRQQAIKDIYGHPIRFLLKDNKAAYFSEDGKKLIAYSGGVEFNRGQKALKEYLDNIFYNNPDYHKHSEFNVIETFFLLLNARLDVVEVRIMYRNYADNKRFYYDSIFVDALKNTTGMWHKTGEDKEWYIYLHRQRIY